MKKLLSFVERSWPFLVFLVFTIGIRIFSYSIMQPVVHTDTISYLFIQELDSVRTPGYPLFLEIFFSLNDLFFLTVDYFDLICFAQIFFLGFLNSLLIYKITEALTANRIFSMLMGIIYNFNFFVVSFEYQILTESLSITLILAGILFYISIHKAKKSSAVLAGIIFVLLIYTRPGFLLLGFALPVLTFLGFMPRSKEKKFWKDLGPFLVIFLLINILGIGAWSMRNQIKYDYFGMSSLMPFNLRWYTNTLIHKYRPRGDEKLNKIAAVYAEEYEKTASSSVTFYNFQKRVSEEMGLTETEISKALLKINIHLIMDYPGEYFEQVPGSMVNYYQQYSPLWAGGNTKKFILSKNLFSKIFKFFFFIYQKLFTSTLFLIILVAAAPIIVLMLTFKNKPVFHGWVIIETFILYNCIVSVFSTNAGVNNLRYRAPVEPLILLVLYAAIFYLFMRIRESGVFLSRHSS
jgi:hypothetical protein